MTIKDLPDNYPWLAGKSRYPMPDVGELAARLESGVRFDRRGDCVWNDKMQTGANSWRSIVAGTGAAWDVSVDYPYWPGYCMKGTTPSDSSKSILIYRYLSPVDVETLGFEIAINCGSAFDYFRMGIQHMDSGTDKTAKIEVNDANEVIKYWDENGAFVNFATYDPLVDEYGKYIVLKLVANFADLNYVRLIVNHVEYDMSAYTMESQVGAGADLTLVDLLYKSVSGNKEFRVGNVVVTAGEA